jgi:hypothetical protein
VQLEEAGCVLSDEQEGIVNKRNGALIRTRDDNFDFDKNITIRKSKIDALLIQSRFVHSNLLENS